MVTADAAAVLEPELDSSDQSLIVLVRAGDADAYGKFYARHVGSDLRPARVLASNPFDVATWWPRRSPRCSARRAPVAGRTAPSAPTC
jgi:hypothetical protein